jgi:hypothetical protein
MKSKKSFGILGPGKAEAKDPERQFFVYSTIGDDILGIWPKDVKKDHINCAHATSSNIVTGDDHGAVKLFKFPCPEPGVK